MFFSHLKNNFNGNVLKINNTLISHQLYTAIYKSILQLMFLMRYVISYQNRKPRR